MKNLILIEAGEKYQYDNLEDLVRNIIDKNYYNLPTEEQKEKLELKAYANCLLEEVDITDQIEKNMPFESNFIIFDEMTYILSLLLLNKVMILESKNSNIFTGDLNKEKIEDNYIIVNHFAKELLEKYINKKLA